MTDVIVIGAGPAGDVLAALRAADLGPRTMLVTRAETSGRKHLSSILRNKIRGKETAMSTLPPARTYNQNHIPRKYTPGKRRLSIYWTWSYPWEVPARPRRNGKSLLYDD